MVSAAEIRDLWEADLLEEANRLNQPEPQPWAELAYMRWHMARSAIPVIEVDPERTWVWSDLHLDDDSVVKTGQRPYGSTTAMNRALLDAWRATVKNHDTVICLGDVAHPDFWNDPRHAGDLAACPGRRILVMGNHDVGQTDELDRAGFTKRHWALMPRGPIHRRRSRTRRSSDGPSRPSTSTGTCTAPKTFRSDTPT